MCHCRPFEWVESPLGVREDHRSERSVTSRPGGDPHPDPRACAEVAHVILDEFMQRNWVESDESEQSKGVRPPEVATEGGG